MRRNNKNTQGWYIAERIGADILMIMLIAWAPWWIIVIAAMFFLFRYAPYYEIIAWGLCLDELYGASYALPYSLSATLIALAALLIFIFLKKRLSLYA
jgi:hypothetical protein